MTDFSANLCYSVGKSHPRICADGMVCLYRALDQAVGNLSGLDDGFKVMVVLPA
jgi:hypothetical protein